MTWLGIVICVVVVAAFFLYTFWIVKKTVKDLALKELRKKIAEEDSASNSVGG